MNIDANSSRPAPLLFEQEQQKGYKPRTLNMQVVSVYLEHRDAPHSSHPHRIRMLLGNSEPTSTRQQHRQ